MEQSRFVALKNEIYDLRQSDLQTSLKVQTELDRQLEYKESKMKLKYLKSTDLPIYRKWLNGTSTWYYRLRNVEGRIVCDIIMDVLNEIAYRHGTVTCIMAEENVKSNEEEFGNAICKLLTHLEK